MAETFTRRGGSRRFVIVMRRVIAALVVLGLALGVFLLWPRGEKDDPPNTQAVATTTTTTSALSTSTSAGTTSTSGEETHVVETVEEAEEILRELWFGWFEGIYNQDEDRIREVVATEQMLQAAKDAFGNPFDSPPSRSGVKLDLEILHADNECLVTWGQLDVTAFLGPHAVTETVQVLRSVDGAWKFATSWRDRNELWEPDCEAQLSPLP